MPADESPAPEDATRHANRLDSAAGSRDVVQARDVHGGVHFHHVDDSFVVTPRQLLGPGHGFVNRDSELAALAEVVTGAGEAPPVVVITGTAGVGKTSLALRWAHGLRERFPDGQLYVNLRGYDPGPPASPEHVLGRFLRDLGVPARAVPADPEERAAQYRSILNGRRLLVVLDNAATVGQVRPLLPGAPGSLAVVTSRSRLSGLVAREGAHRLRLDLLTDEEAVALLRAVTRDYRTGDSPTELMELAGLCARLPLALRIAAERAAARPMMRLNELIADLRDESGLWDALTVNGDEDADADAVRTVLAWSYRALPEPAARLFRLLGLHPGNEFSVPAATALAGTDLRSTRQSLDALVGAHLVEQTGPDRYQFHDLLRAYAIDQVRQLETEATRGDARRRVLTWYLYTADAAASQVVPFDRFRLAAPAPDGIAPPAFDGQETARRWFRTEAGNLVVAVRAAADAGQHATAWQLAAVLRGHYAHQNAFDEWITIAQLGAESAAELGDRAGEAEALESLGKAYFQSRRLDEAEAHHRRALDIRRDLGDRFGEGVSINALGLLGLRHRHPADAASRFRQGEQIFAELDRPRWVALLRVNLAEAMCERGDFAAAAEKIREVLPVFREVGDQFGEGNGRWVLAWAHRGAGRLDEARAAIEQALEIAAGADNDVWLAHWLVELGRIQLAQDQPAHALAACQRAAVIQRRLGDRSREAMAIDTTGLAYQQLGRYDEAAGFHRRAASVHRSLRDHWHLAAALDHLAAALANDEALALRREAVSLLDGFDDPPANAMRERLTRILAGR